MSVVEAVELGRWYGQVVGLNELTVEIGPGITALVGPNGAGKSTLLKLIAGELRPSRGSIRVLGLDPFASRALHRRFGFAPQQDALYGHQSALDMVRFLLRLTGFDRREAKLRAERALARVGLQEAQHRRVGGFSKGMRQRVRIAQAIAHDPELVVLDEPLAGLDPLGRRAMQELLRELGRGGAHVLVSSHVLHELEDLTSEILLLHRGRLLAQGPVSEVRRLIDRHPAKVELRARAPRELAQRLLAFEEVLSVHLGPEEDLVALETRDTEAFWRRLTEIAAVGGFGITAVESADSGLEAVFDYLVS